MRVRRSHSVYPPGIEERRAMLHEIIRQEQEAMIKRLEPIYHELKRIEEFRGDVWVIDGYISSTDGLKHDPSW